MPRRKTLRKTVTRQGALHAQRNAIWKSPDWITRGLDFCMRHGRWQEWEDRLLAELLLGRSYDYDSATIYCFKVLGRRWPDLETLLVGLVHAPDLRQLNVGDFLYFVRYSRYHNGSPTLENQILEQGSPAAAFAYTAYGTRRRWPEAEPLILSGDTAASPALSTGIGDILDAKQWADPWESQAVTYARLFLKSGWPALEDKMARGECHPQVAYEYAVNVLQGTLPQAIETWLVLAVCEAEGNKYRQKYFAFKTAKKGQPSQANAGSRASAP